MTAFYFSETLIITYLKTVGHNICISLTECKSGTTQKLSLGINSTIERKNTKPTFVNTGSLVSGNIQRKMPLLSVVVVTFFISIVVLPLNGQFLVCATNAFSERYVQDRFQKHL